MLFVISFLFPLKMANYNFVARLALLVSVAAILAPGLTSGKVEFLYLAFKMI